MSSWHCSFSPGRHSLPFIQPHAHQGGLRAEEQARGTVFPTLGMSARRPEQEKWDTQQEEISTKNRCGLGTAREVAVPLTPQPKLACSHSNKVPFEKHSRISSHYVYKDGYGRRCRALIQNSFLSAHADTCFIFPNLSRKLQHALFDCTGRYRTHSHSERGRQPPLRLLPSEVRAFPARLQISLPHCEAARLGVALHSERHALGHPARPITHPSQRQQNFQVQNHGAVPCQ